MLASSRIWRIRYLLLVSIVPLSSPAYSLASHEIISSIGQYQLGNSIEVLEDPDGSLIFEDILAADKSLPWFQTEKRIPIFGYSNSIYWFRFVVTNNSGSHMEKFLEIAYPHLDQIDLYLGKGGQPWKYHQLGDTLPFSERWLEYRNFVIPLNLPDEAELTVIGRIQTTSSVQIPITIWSPEIFAEQKTREMLGFGLYYGIILVMIFYNFFLFISVRDLNYLYYTLYVSTYCMFMLSLHGLAFQHLWPNSPEWTNTAIPVFQGAAGLCFLIFSRRFLDIRRQSKIIDGLVLFMLAYSCLTLIYPFFGKSSVAIKMGVALGPLISLYLFIVGIRFLIRGYRPARFYVLAFSFLFLGLLILAFKSVGWIPVNVITSYGIEIGSALELLLFSFALGDKIKMEQDQHRKSIERLNTSLEASLEKERLNQKELINKRDQLKALSENLEHKVSEQTRELVEKNNKLQMASEQKTRFFQNISHELRTPLTLLLTPLEILQQNQPDNEQLGTAFRNAKRLLRLVNQLLDFQKLSSNKFKDATDIFEVNSFLNRCASYFQTSCDHKSIYFAQQFAVGSIYIKGSVDSLEKIVFNYFSNALKFTPSGGHICLFTRIADDKIIIGIKDSGPGIADDKKDQLFQVFSQLDNSDNRAYEGTGLGLAFAKELAEHMSGAVGVDSQLGNGSTFWVQLPLVSSSSEQIVHSESDLLALDDYKPHEWHFSDLEMPIEIEKPVEIQAKNAPLALIIDDVADMRKLLNFLLRRHGFVTVEADCARAGLEILEKQSPDIIIVDWMMPVMTGPEMIKIIKQDPKLQTIPTVLLTAKFNDQSRAEGIELGADAFLGKPFDEKELISLVRNLVRLKSGEKKIAELTQALAEKVLKRFLPPTIVQDIIDGKKALDEKPKKEHVTIMFIDLVNFTGAAYSLGPEKISLLLNEYLSRMSQVIFDHGGTIDKFIGDGIMVIFGSPEKLSVPNQIDKAVTTASAILEELKILNNEWERQGMPDFGVRIGIHTGPAIVGNFGSSERIDYTVIGPTVNLAARIQTACYENHVFMSQEVCEHLPQDRWTEAGKFTLKGIDEPVSLFLLIDGALEEAV